MPSDIIDLRALIVGLAGDADGGLPLPSEPPVPANPACLYLASLPAASSRRTMRAALEGVLRTIGAPAEIDAFAWHNLTYPHVAAIRAQVLSHLAPSTANKYLAAVRGVLNAAFNAGMIDGDTLARARAAARGVVVETLPAGRDVASEELAALVAECRRDASPAGARDAAILALLYAGLRRSEVVRLTAADLSLTSGAVIIRQAKRRKDRKAYLAPGGVRALSAWVAVRSDAPGALICAVSDNGALPDVTLTSQAIYAMLKRRCRAAGIRTATPHDLRRTFIGDALSAGVDISHTAKLAGHASVTQTARYDRRPDDERAAAAQRLNFPYGA